MTLQDKALFKSVFICVGVVPLILLGVIMAACEAYHAVYLSGPIQPATSEQTPWHYSDPEPAPVQQTRAVPVRELVEHFNACVQNYTRTAHPIALELAETRCNCAGEYLAANGYGDASFKEAQKACGAQLVSR